jgi:hypothetical protein
MRRLGSGVCIGALEFAVDFEHPGNVKWPQTGMYERDILLLVPV